MTSSLNRHEHFLIENAIYSDEPVAIDSLSVELLLRPAPCSTLLPELFPNAEGSTYDIALRDPKGPSHGPFPSPPAP